MLVACLAWRERLPATSPHQEIAFCGQEASCHSSGRWTFRSVRSLGSVTTQGRQTVWASPGQLPVPSHSVMRTHGAHAAVVDTAWAVYGVAPSQRVEALTQTEPSPRAYSHQQEPICALSHCPASAWLCVSSPADGFPDERRISCAIDLKVVSWRLLASSPTVPTKGRDKDKFFAEKGRTLEVL